MKTYKIKMAAGDIKAVPARKFTHYIGCIGQEFIVHDSQTHHCKVVSELRSGKKVCDVTVTDSACTKNDIDAARRALNNLVQRYGETRVNVVINSAEPLQSV